jgi:hypothetical protein
MYTALLIWATGILIEVEQAGCLSGTPDLHAGQCFFNLAVHAANGGYRAV